MSVVQDLPPAAVISEATSSLYGFSDWTGAPYPGLRPFGRDEMEIFFGRERALDSMVDLLAERKFLAVLGPSGCGKSSLVKTGLYTTLTLGLLPNAGGRWRIAEFTPGCDPMLRMARALVDATADARGRTAEAPGDAIPEAERVELVAAHLRRGPRAVTELVKGGMLGDEQGWNLLIVVDQFEELFRFRDYAGREKTEAFAELLLESARSPLPIHIVVTMRSEYLGACSLISGLAEAISAGMYLTPRMTRSECREAIEGPARVRGFDLEPELVSRLLNDLENFAPFEQQDRLDPAEQLSLQADQLPLMQHVLNRMWRRARGAHRAEDGRLTIRLADYEEVGGLTGALDDHGAEIVARLVREAGPGAAATIERVFRALVDGPSLPLAIRRPRQFDSLVAAAGGEANREQVAKVVEAFRSPACNFLRTSEATLGSGVMVDLGHESLIRRWTKLSCWFAKEVDATAMWRRLIQDAELWQEGEGSLLSDLSLRRVVEWWDGDRPLSGASDRCADDSQAACAYLQASRAAAARQARRRTLLRAAAALGMLLIVAVSISWWVSLARHNSELRVAVAEAAEQRQNADRSRSMAQDFYRTAMENGGVLREFLGQRQCRQFTDRPGSYEACIDQKIQILRQDLLATRPAVSQQPSSGGERVH